MNADLMAQFIIAKPSALLDFPEFFDLIDWHIKGA